MTHKNPTDWLSLARDAYQSSNSYFDASIRNGVEADLRQFQGQHPQGSKYLAESSRGRSKLFRPKTRAVIRKNEAAAAEAFFSSNDVLSVRPEDDNDDLQRASAAVMQELLQYRLTKTIPWFLLLIGAYQDAMAVGVVASYQYWEFNPKKKIDRPAIRLIPVENLRFDPGADWTDPVGTSPYVIELIPMYIKDVKARMQRVDPKTGEAKWHQLDDAVIATAAKSYGDTIRQQREGQGRIDSKYQTQANNQFNIVWVHKNIIEIDEVDYVYYTLGTEHLLSDPQPLEQAYFHGKRPYVVGCSILETHKIYPSSVPRLTKDVQAEINEVANQRIDNVKLALNKRYFAKRNKQVDLRSVTKNVPGSVTLMQDTDDVKVVEFNDVTGSSYKEQEILNLDFDDVAGSFSTSSVQSNRKLNETVGGMRLLDTNANQVSSYQLRTFVETWVEPVLRQLVALEQYYETDEVLIGLAGQAAKIVQRYGIDAVTDDMLMQQFTLNVNVGLGATNPMDQLKQFVDGMTALRDMLADGTLINFGLNVEEVIKELFGKLGYKDGARFFDMDDQNPQVAQLKATIAELQAQLQAKVDPRLLEAQIRKIDAEIASLGVRDTKDKAQAVKTGVEAAFSAMQAGEVIAAVPQVAPIADEVMKAAGYTVPNPVGVDPNFPIPPAPAPGLSLDEVWNRKTGVSFMPGVNTMPVQAGPAAFDPPTPGIGVRQGIQTPAADSVGLANGGAIARYVNGGLLDGIESRGIDGLSDEERLATRLQQRMTAPNPANSFGLPSGMTPMEAGSAMMDVVHSGALAPEQGALLREAASRVANPDYVDNGRPANLGLSLTGYTDDTERELGIGGYADGGQIVGPGTGTSDSIAAVANGQPIAVSNGEYHIPRHVVDAIGRDFFDALLAQLHTPVAGQGSAAPQTAPPLPLDNGDYIIPADVVAALGADFFDRLVQLHGRA